MRITTLVRPISKRGLDIACQTKKLSPSAEKLKIWSQYPPRAFVGRKLSDAGDRGKPGYQREWQEFFRPRSIDMDRIWKVYGFVISFGS
jgi:hypothetical protein